MQQAENEWTVVHKKTRRFRHRNRSVPNGFHPTPHLTVEQIQKDFDSYNTQFKASLAARVLQSAIKEFASYALSVNNKKPVTKAINLGIGSFDPADGSWTWKRTAHIQLAAMLHIVSLLEEHTSSGRIKCTFQEPLFTSSDIAFLTAMGHEVVESPVASNSVTAETLFFGPHLYKELYGMALKGEIPAIWVGTDWVVWEENILSSSREEHLVKIKKMHDTYKQVPFPSEDKDNVTVFYGTCLYLKYPEQQAATDNATVQQEQGREIIEIEDDSSESDATVQQEQGREIITIEDDSSESDD